MNWKHLPIGLLCLSLALAAFGLAGLLAPNYFTTFYDNPTLAIHVMLIGLVGIGYVAWLKR